MVDPSPIHTPEPPPVKRLRGGYRRAAIAFAVVLAAALVVLALSRLDLHPRRARADHRHARLDRARARADGALAGAALDLLAPDAARRAARHADRAGRAVMRATMIGVMASAVFPGRIGEPTRVVVLTRRLDGPNRRLLPVVAGHGLLADADQPARARDPRGGHVHAACRCSRPRRRGSLTALAVPLAVCALVIAGPRLLALGAPLALAAAARAPPSASRGCCSLARAGPGRLRAPALRHRRRSPRSCCAWTLQWLACYAVLLALGLQSAGRPGCRRPRSCSRSTSARSCPPRPSNVGRLPGGLPGRARRLRRRRRAGARVRHHPAGRRGRSPRSRSASRRCSARA